VVTVYNGLAPATAEVAAEWPPTWVQRHGVTRKVEVVYAATVPHSTMHWHAHAVRALAFTPDGTGLLSGGEEAVLVRWHLHTGARRFLPRIGSGVPIDRITPNPAGTIYAVTTVDNTVHFVSVLSWMSVSHMRGLRPVLPETQPMPMVPAPGSPGHVFMCGLPAEVQLYDVLRDEHVADLAVCATNAVSRGDEAEPSLPRVEHVALSANGQTMLTVDRRAMALRNRPHHSKYTVECLRFWRRVEEDGRFVVHTRIDQPHQGGETTQVAFHPSQALAVTASQVGAFRVWRERPVSEDVTEWVALRTGAYRDLPCLACSFSPDGSLLAVSCESVLTLWTVDTATSNLKMTQALSHPPPAERITSLAFAGGDTALVVCQTARSVYVWNLLTVSVWWSARLDVLGMVADPTSSIFALSVLVPTPDSSPQEEEKTQGARRGPRVAAVVLFNAASPEPVFSEALPRDCNIRSMAFLDLGRQADGRPSSGLVWVDNHAEVHYTAPTGTFIAHRPKFTANDGAVVADPVTAGALGSHDRSNDQEEQDTFTIDFARGRLAALNKVGRLVDADSHVLPGAAVLLGAAMKSLTSEEPAAGEPEAKGDTDTVVRDEPQTPTERVLPAKPSRKRYFAPDEITSAAVMQYASFFEGLLRPSSKISPDRTPREKQPTALGESTISAHQRRSPKGEEVDEVEAVRPTKPKRLRTADAGGSIRRESLAEGSTEEAKALAVGKGVDAAQVEGSQENTEANVQGSTPRRGRREKRVQVTHSEGVETKQTGNTLQMDSAEPRKARERRRSALEVEQKGKPVPALTNEGSRADNESDTTSQLRRSTRVRKQRALS